MTTLLRRAAVCTGLAACGLSTVSPAQVPERTELRRALPVAGASIVQQSPNGLYQLSITDTGIELRGPQAVVKINDTGIHIGDPGTNSVTIDATQMGVMIGQDLKLTAGRTMDIRSTSAIQMRANAAVQITGDGGVSLMGSQVTLGCANGKPAARIGDQVNTSASPAVIAQGSQTVLVC